MSTANPPSTLAKFQIAQPKTEAATSTADRAALAYRPLDWKVVTLSLATFLSISYTLCVIHCLIFPGIAQYFAESWTKFLPGFVWLSWGSFLLGLAETIVYGLYIGLVFTLFYNLFARIFHGQR